MYKDGIVKVSPKFVDGVRRKQLVVAGKVFGTRQEYLDKLQSYFPDYIMIKE